MDKRFTLFAVLVALVFIGNQIVLSYLYPPKPAEPKPAAVAKADPAKDAAAKEEAPADAQAADAAGADENKAPPEGQASEDQPTAVQPAAEAPPVEAQPVEAQWGSLGSGNPEDPYRMLVTWTNRGAAIERLELNSPRYRDLDDRSGYLGYLSPADAPQRGGAIVQVVGPGTPAAAAGLKPGDVITAVSGQKISNAAHLVDTLRQTKPNEEVQLTVTREGAAQQLTASLIREPLAVLRPEFDSKPVDVLKPKNHDPLSYLMTIQQFDDRSLPNDDQELAGVNLRSAEWEVVSSNQEQVTFRATLPKLGLQVTKSYRLAKVPTDELEDPTFPAYNLMLDVSVANIGDKTRQVAYRLDGPTGLPLEGAWYANKIGWGTWSGVGLRDIVTRFYGSDAEMTTTAQIADKDFNKNWANFPLDYIAVDAQYFASALIPQKKQPEDLWFAEVRPIRVGAVPEDKAHTKLTNVSFRLDSTVAELEPQGKALEHQFQIFAGPKRPALLAAYGPPGATLSDLEYYGWFGVVAKPMLAILHTFYAIVGNYGVAIIMLTVLVRGCMFPLSRKQALSAQKMQELQPEIKRLNEKYKNDAEKRTRAQQELFRQHNYNPLGGCLLAFVQLPIFVGLYRSLMVDVELRQAPLFGEGIRWASNLSAPDMFWNWSSMMPDFITHGTGFFGLGPYLNILPLFTIGLFIWQQKMFMPPPADEQAAMQQKLMQYMMIFMGFMFFKVASGLCLYFIASSLWGIAERKLLPKANPPKSGPTGGEPAKALTTAPAKAPSGNGAPAGKKRQRGRK